MITPIVLKPANAGRTKVVIIHHGIYCIFPLVIDICVIPNENVHPTILHVRKNVRYCRRKNPMMYDYSYVLFLVKRF